MKVYGTAVFSTYLEQDNDFHLGRNSSTLIRNVIGEATNFSSLLNQCFIFLSDILVVMALLMLVFMISPLGSISAFGLFTAAWLLFHFTLGKKMPRWGNIRNISDNLRQKHARQGLGAYKEVNLLGKESAFVDFYQPHNEKSARMAQYNSFTKSLPRVLFGTTAVMFVIVIRLFQSLGKQSGVRLVPKLGLFAMAAYRIIPSINRLASGYNAIQFSIVVIDVIHRDMSRSKLITEVPQHPEHFGFDHEIAMRDVHFRYLPSEPSVLVNASLTIKKGEIASFIGESDSGKSAIADLLLGLLQPQSRTIDVDGIDICNNLRDWQRCVGYVPQTVFICDDTLAGNLAFGAPPAEIDEERVTQVVGGSGLSELVEANPEGIKMPLGENSVRLSGGQRQQVGIARALYKDPDILGLDEATSALDTQTKRWLIQTLEAMHGIKTILIVSHRNSTLSYCDRILYLEKEVFAESEKQATAYI